MIRKAFRMSVQPEHHDEYVRRHNPIWPELEATLRAHGVRSYSIFLDPETSDLFAYAEIDSEEQWAAIGRLPAVVAERCATSCRRTRTRARLRDFAGAFSTLNSRSRA